MRPLLVALALLITPAASGAQRAPRCVAGPDAAEASARTPLRAGRYRLVLVATRGTRAGRRAEGTLELWSASSADRSPAHPAERPPPDVGRTPLVGATGVDFAAVGAPVSGRGDGDVPAPTSRDPLHPGVVVESDGSGPPDILIGTLWNRRVNDGRVWLDGPGVHLPVRRQRGDSVWGAWEEFGIVANGSGYYCMTRVQDP